MSDSTAAALHHDPHLAHHFDTMEQQYTSAKLGMWLFLVTEILLFSGLFLAYAVFRALHPEVFDQASRMLNLTMGATNTVVLICSSLTMALAVRAGQTGNRSQQIIQLTLTLLLAGTFMVIKYFEYSAKITHGVLPGWYFAPHGAEYAWIGEVPYARTFFSIYFMATGLHGFHVFCGMVLIAWLLRRCVRGDFSPAYFYPIEVIGLYWHIVDMIWIFLFPVLYLVDRT